MPSGVSHGSAPPAGLARAVLSKAIFAKFGMRLMGFHYSTGDFGERYSQSWSGCWWLTMLPSFSAPKFCSVVWLGRLATPTTHPSRDSVPYCWHHPVGAVERSGHDLDPRTIDQTVTQRGAAIAAEIALGDRGRAECSGLAL